MKTNTLRTVLMTSALAASATVTSVAAHAESFTLTVPFAFSAGGKMLPAGDYIVDASSMMVTVKGTGGSAMTLAIPSSADLATGKTSAMFDESAEMATLASVKLSDGTTYRLPAMKHTTLAAVSPPEGAVLSKRP